MYRSDDYYREQIFNGWFEKYTKVYEMMRDGKMCDIRVDIKYAPFISTFSSAYKKYMRYYDSPMDCYSDCMALVWEGMLNFKINNGSTWEKIAKGEDLDNYKKLVSYLKTHVFRMIKKITQDYSETSKTINDCGKKKSLHVYYNISPESLNRIVTFDNSLEQVELINSIENSFWEEKMNYRYGIFIEWVRDNMNNFLTKSQMELLDTLQKANYSSLDNDWDMSMVENSKGQIKLRLERICDKVTAKYCEERKLITGGYVVQEIDKEIHSFQKFVNVLNDENCDDKLLSHIIVSSMNNPYWERLLYEDISEESLESVIVVKDADTVVYEDTFKLFNRTLCIDKESMYEITNAVADRLKFLIKSREYEMSLLKDEADKKKTNIKQMHFKLPENFSSVYLGVTPTGIMIEK